MLNNLEYAKYLFSQEATSNVPTIFIIIYYFVYPPSSLINHILVVEAMPDYN